MFNFRKISALWRKAEHRTPFEQAIFALEGGDVADAYRRLSDLLAGEPLPASQQALMRNKRGVALVRMNRKSEALAEFLSALRLQPAFPAALVNLGNLSLEDGDIHKAVAHYEAAVRCDETYAIAHLNLGVAYKKLGRHGDAVRELRTASRLEGRTVKKR